MKKILKERMDIEIDEHEVGYVALHIHSALGDEKVSVAMQTARTVRECIAMIEMATGRKIDVISLSYNRMMNHIKYMVARVSTGETLKLDMNEYIEKNIRNPTGSQRMSARVWAKALGKSWTLSRLVILPCILSGQWNNKCKWLIRLRDLHNKFNSFFDSSTHGSTAVCD